VLTGSLNRNLTFQAPSGSPVAWTTIFTCKGAVWPLNSSESLQSLALGGTITGKIRIRYRPVSIKPTWRVLCGNTIYSIVGPPINVSGNNTYLEIRVKETV
jgi:SPP1 family predicted phage head-tail adaptor